MTLLVAAACGHAARRAWRRSIAGLHAFSATMHAHVVDAFVSLSSADLAGTYYYKARQE